MVAVNAVAGIVFIDNLVKHIGPGEIAVSGLNSFPGGGTQMFGAGLAIYIAHILQPQNTGQIIMASLYIAHSTEHRNRPRGAGGLMAASGNRGQLRIGLGKETTD